MLARAPWNILIIQMQTRNAYATPGSAIPTSVKIPGMRPAATNGPTIPPTKWRTAHAPAAWRRIQRSSPGPRSGKRTYVHNAIAPAPNTNATPKIMGDTTPPSGGPGQCVYRRKGGQPEANLELRGAREPRPWERL